MQTSSANPSPVRNDRGQTRGQPGRRAARREHEQAAARQRRVVTVAASIIVLLLVGLVVLRLMNSASTAANPDQPAPASLVAEVTTIDPAILEQVGRGSLQNLPTPLRAAIDRGPDGLPLITYIGAEYCPFCAGERWPLIVALGRFGTFSGLQLSHSAPDDIYPNTPTFSFVGSSYSSQYIGFSPVELQSNVRSGSGYQTLQTPTPAQTSLLQKYDAAPYVPAQGAGSIPFIHLGGQYIVSGASYDVNLLRGMTQEQLAAGLSDPSRPQTQAILGTANALTAAICSATNDAPANVCGLANVKSLEASLGALPVPGTG